MPLLHLLVLALVQGITEFLPISSSGHLVLVDQGFDALGLATAGEDAAGRQIMHVAVHIGTLLAVCGYFWRDLVAMIAGVLRLIVGRRDAGARLAGHVVLATVPVLIVGFALRERVAMYLQDVEVVAWATIIFAVFLYAADKTGMTVRRLEHMKLPDPVVIGMLQILALIPGTSRAGITMTGARLLGYERRESARFSMLLAIPTILGAGVLAGADLQASGDLQLGLDALVAAAFAFLAALLAIALLMRWLTNAGFTPFVIYRLILGAGLLWMVYA